MTAIDLSSYFGLAAMTLLTLNILIGLVMSVKYNPVRNWPHRRINTFKGLRRAVHAARDSSRYAQNSLAAATAAATRAPAEAGRR